MTSENASDGRALEDLKNEIVRKIGRNILNLQQIELMGKFLTSGSDLEAYAGEAGKARERRADRVQKQQSLGHLVKGLEKDVLVTEETEQKGPGDPSRPWLAVRFMIRADPAVRDAKVRELKALVEERNVLVHNLIEKYDLGSLESCLELNAFLDRQHERVCAQHSYLNQLTDALDESWNELRSYLKTREGREKALRHFRTSEGSEALLHEVAATAARPDGWTYLSTAGNLLPNAPGEREQLMTQYGVRTLRDLVLAIGSFEILEEPTPGGGVRVLFRPKAETG